MRPKISGCTMAHREVESLRRALDSLAWCDERLVVLDTGAPPEAEAIARDCGARVIAHAYEGDIEQKGYAAAAAEHDWVIHIDADEVVTPDLAQEIRAALERSGPEVAGFELARRTWHLGRWIDHGDFNPDRLVRVFDRKRMKLVGANPHGRFRVSGSVVPLRGWLLHYSYRDLADQVNRIQAFSDQAAEAMAREGRRFRLSDMLLRPPIRFFRGYVLKKGYRDGLPGLVVAVASAFHVFLKYAKLWERGLPPEKRPPPP